MLEGIELRTREISKERNLFYVINVLHQVKDFNSLKRK